MEMKAEEVPVRGHEVERMGEERGQGWDKLVDLGRGGDEEVGYDEEGG